MDKYIKWKKGKDWAIHEEIRMYSIDQLYTCIYYIFTFMYSIYTHIFALTINMIQFLCCSIDRKIFRPQLYQQFIPKVYPQSFISRNKYFEAYFVAWGFPHSGALWEKVSDLLLLFRNQSDQLYGFTYFLYVIHLNFSTDELECFFFFHPLTSWCGRNEPRKRTRGRDLYRLTKLEQQTSEFMV